MLVSHIIDIINNAAPEKYALSWDNSGFLVGDKNSPVKKVLLALDVTEETAMQAQNEGCDMIISHHPMFFGGIKSVDYETAEGRTLRTLIKNDIAVYACHTNMDAAENGINAYLAELFELTDTVILENNPETPGIGIGRVGNLPKEYTLEELCGLTKKLLNTPCVRAVKGNENKISVLAVASGSCSEYIEKAASLGADAIITGDMKYHDSLDAKGLGINVIDAGHYPTEFLVTDIFEKLLENTGIQTVKSNNKDVFIYI